MVASDSRPEIRPHYWQPADGSWPMTKKPDLIFFDPPYFSKKAKEYKEKAGEKTPPISSFTKPEYEKFFEDFFRLAYRHSKPTTTMAFLNADWLDFQSTPASQERPDNAIKDLWLLNPIQRSNTLSSTTTGSCRRPAGRSSAESNVRCQPNASPVTASRKCRTNASSAPSAERYSSPGKAYEKTRHQESY